MSLNEQEMTQESDDENRDPSRCLSRSESLRISDMISKQTMDIGIY